MQGKQNIFLFLAALLLATSSTAMEEDLLRSVKPLRITLEETIPEGDKKQAIVAFLKATTKAPIQIDDDPKSKREFGFSFPPSSPCCLLVAKYIKTNPWEGRPNLGDWGCGYGFFSFHALLAGANPWGLELNKSVADRANKNIWAAKPYLSSDLKLKDLYKVSQGSVTDPGPDFMARQNHINVAFNVIHYLTPTDADKFLENLYQNTAPNGLVFLSADTPFSQPGPWAFYNRRKEQGVKYPGYALYSVTSWEFLSDLQTSEGSKQSIRSVYPFVDEEKFKMGQRYPGLYPVDAARPYDDGRVITVTKNSLEFNIFDRFEKPYSYISDHRAFNKFDYDALKNVLESVGFSVVNGWYADRERSDVLSPVDPSISRETVVVVAQKRLPSS